jgi:hypothetical protein
MMRRLALLFSSLLFFISLSAEDWPAFGGPDRNQVSLEKGLRTNWGDEEPERLWVLDIGLGYSGVVEVKGKAYTQGYSNGKNTLFLRCSRHWKSFLDSSVPLPKSPQVFSGREP